MRSKQMLIVHKDRPMPRFLGFYSLHGLLFLVQQLQENNLLFTSIRLLSRCKCKYYSVYQNYLLHYF